MQFFKGKNKDDKPYFSKEPWKYYLGFFEGEKYKLIGTSIGATLQAFLIIPTLLLVRYIFDVVIPGKEPGILILVGLAILGIRLISMGLTLFLRKINIGSISKIIFRIRKHLTLRVYAFSRTYYTREDLRVLHTRIIQDTERIMSMSNTLVSSLASSVFISIGLCLILAFFNWFLFLIILSFFPVIFFSNRYLGKIVKKKVFAYQRSFEGFSKITMFVMKFMDLIKIQSTEKQESQRQIEILEDLRQKTETRTFFFSVSGQVQTFLVGISGILVIVIGGISVMNGLMTLGDFFAFYIAANHLQTNINNISNSFTTIVTGNESLITLYDIASNHETEPYAGTKKIDFKGSLSLKSVSFKYTDKPILKDVSLQISPGTKMAIIGANGAGKSTIIRLILGFYKPQQGMLSADDIPYHEINFQHFRRSIGVVSQHPPLVSGSIRQNIMYGNEWVLEADILAVSKLSLGHDFISRLPKGYETQIGEDGVLLSGGERQKVAIARALLRKPKLLILDEPTNHLDHEAVKNIMQNLNQIDYKPTILIISHDMDVVKHAAEIYIIDKGELHPFK